MRYPLSIFEKANEAVSHHEVDKSCFILLNSELYGMERWVKEYWHSFVLTACADGGANTLYDSMGEERHKYVPTLICGDLDSARPEVLQYYRDKGSTVIHYTDQDSTDFSKTLYHLNDLRKNGTVEFTRVYVLNALWGRFDQTMGNIGTMCRAENELDEAVSIYLMSEDSLLFLLKPGTTVIAVDSGFEEGHCGLIPIGEPCRSCTTAGLKWNLDGQSIEMMGLFSTCNIISTSAKQVTVTNSNPLLWTMSHTLKTSS